MTQPPPPASPHRTNDDYRWTRDKACAFIDALVKTGKVATAARMVGMSRQSAYRLRARLGPEFSEVWDKGLVYSVVWRQEQLARKGAPKVTPERQGDTAR